MTRPSAFEKGRNGYRQLEDCGGLGFKTVDSSSCRPFFNSCEKSFTRKKLQEVAHFSKFKLRHWPCFGTCNSVSFDFQVGFENPYLQLKSIGVIKFRITPMWLNRTGRYTRSLAQRGQVVSRANRVCSSGLASWRHPASRLNRSHSMNRTVSNPAHEQNCPRPKRRPCPT